jgi:hypothetical protein
MKNNLRRLIRAFSRLPILGRFIRILIAIIRLPEERIQFKQHMAEHAMRMQREEDALRTMNERLARHEMFITSQIPRLAQKVAELHQPRLPNN